jgi:hypothetical protein
VGRRQLQRAQSETEKLAAAAENYKRDLLRQRAADAEHEVATLKDRLKESVSDNESASPDPGLMPLRLGFSGCAVQDFSSRSFLVSRLML